MKKEYIDKSSLLFHSCKNTKNYPYLRQNLDKTIYDYDKNNELIIAFPKFNLKQTNNSNQNNDNFSSAKKYNSIKF